MSLAMFGGILDYGIGATPLEMQPGQNFFHDIANDSFSKRNVAFICKMLFVSVFSDILTCTKKLNVN